MARINSLTNFLDDVATAIKQKTGDNTPIQASEFDTEILSIETAGTYQQKSITISNNGTQTITPDTNYDAIERLTITTSVPVYALQTKSVEITTNGSISILPDTNYDGMTQVDLTVSVPQQGGSGDVKLFETIADMQADADPQEGDLAVVYKDKLIPLSPGDITNVLNFPDEVVFDTPITTSSSLVLSAGFLPLIRINCDLTPTGFSVFSMGITPTIDVHYTTSDGLTYIKDRGDSSYSLTQYITIPTTADTNILKFLLKINQRFDGLYKYNTDQYVIADSQLNATAEYVYKKEFYGMNGSETGTLTDTVSTSFTDVNAEVAAKIQKQYDNMTPRVLTDSDKTIDTGVYLIPTKTDGTLLLDTSQVTNMDTLFSRCSKLITIPKIDTSNVTTMRSMFFNCSKLETIPLLDTSNVTDMYDMFRQCSNLISIPLLDTSNVTNMFAMFSGCTNLANVPLLDLSNVTSLENIFSGCKSLTSIPLLDISSVTCTGNMFENCISLTSVPLYDTSNVTIMSEMFENCSALVDIPLLNTSKIEKMRDTFKNCTSLSNTSLNNVLQMCINATNYAQTKTLKYIGISGTQATTCQSLSNYSAFTSAGWTTGY